MTVQELDDPEEEPAAEQAVFTAGEIARAAGATTGKVAYWVRRKLIRPSVRRASGKGSRRVFDRFDLQKALLVNMLSAARWKPKQIEKVLTAVAAAWKRPASLHAPILVHEGNAVLILCRDKGTDLTIMDAANPGQSVMVIALETLEEETRQRLAESK